MSGDALNLWAWRLGVRTGAELAWWLVLLVALSAPASSSQPKQETEPPEAKSDPTLPADEFEAGGVRQVILSAKTTSVVGVRRLWRSSLADPVAAKKRVEKRVRKWGRFTVVDDPTQADLVLVIIEGTNDHTNDGSCNHDDDESFHWFLPSGCESDGKVTYRLTARLRVFRGADFSKPDPTPLWDSGEIENFSYFISAPAARALGLFRKFVKALEKERGK